MAVNIPEKTPAQVKADQMRDLYLDLYPIIAEDFAHKNDVDALHRKINQESQMQTRAFEALRLVFNMHFHSDPTSGVTGIPTTVASISMRPITSLPDDLLARSLIRPPRVPFELIPSRVGEKAAMPPFRVTV